MMKPKELKRRTNEEWTDAGRTTGASGSGPTNSIAFQYCVCFVFMDGEKNFNQETPSKRIYFPECVEPFYVSDVEKLPGGREGICAFFFVLLV